MDRVVLIDYLDSFLRIKEIEDYGPQGLQVETDNDQVNRLGLAVDTSTAAIEAAVQWRADMLLVHHGLFWGTVEPVIGPLARRIRLLMANGINLYGAHLPLDAHPEVGNNAVLARMLGVEVTRWWNAPKGTPIGVFGSVTESVSLATFGKRVEDALGTSPKILAHGPRDVHQVAIVSGFGADDIKDARALGADTYLTGETSHSHYWDAYDYGMNVVFGGHYATETVGVKVLGQHLSDKFGLEIKFLDFPTSM